LGPEKEGTLLNHVPPDGLSDLDTERDRAVLSAEAAAIEEELIAALERMERRVKVWTMGTALASATLAFAAAWIM
jgi:hypothetical protein